MTHVVGVINDPSETRRFPGYSVKPYYSNRRRSAPSSTAGAIEQLDDLPVAPESESR
jgi:hypothetical protein